MKIHNICSIILYFILSVSHIQAIGQTNQGLIYITGGFDYASVENDDGFQTGQLAVRGGGGYFLFRNFAIGGYFRYEEVKEDGFSSMVSNPFLGKLPDTELLSITVYQPYVKYYFSQRDDFYPFFQLAGGVGNVDLHGVDADVKLMMFEANAGLQYRITTRLAATMKLGFAEYLIADLSYEDNTRDYKVEQKKFELDLRNINIGLMYYF